MASTVDAKSIDTTSTRADANDVARVPNANPAFRTANADELVNEDNTFRGRIVRTTWSDWTSACRSPRGKSFFLRRRDLPAGAACRNSAGCAGARPP